MKPISPLLGPYLQSFFTEHLSRHKRLSPQTIASLRDSFRLLLEFLHARTGSAPANVRITDLDAFTVLAFLDHLEESRGNTIRSRNLRLSAIRTFFRYLALRDPDRLGQVTQVMAIPVKREDKKLIRSLTREEIDAILATPDRSEWAGRRDYVLLLTMYNSGARVSEMTTLTCGQVRFGTTTYLQLYGKGRKERTVPLWPHTARVLEAWFNERAIGPGSVAFPNARGHEMARDGVEYILRQAVKRATKSCPSLSSRSISPHVVRHYLPFRIMSRKNWRLQFETGFEAA